MFAVQIRGVGVLEVPVLTLDTGDNPYIAVNTLSAPNLPITPGAYAPSTSDLYKRSWVSKFSNLDGHPIFSTYVDIVINNVGGLAADSAGNGYFAGSCATSSAQLCVEKLDTTGSVLVYNTALDPNLFSGMDIAYMAVDRQGDVCVASRKGGMAILNPSGAVTATAIGPPMMTPVAVAFDATGHAQIAFAPLSSLSSPFLVRRLSADLSGVLFSAALMLPSGWIAGMSIDPEGVTNLWGHVRTDLKPIHPTQACTSNAFLARLGNEGQILQSSFLQAESDFIAGSPMRFGSGTLFGSGGATLLTHESNLEIVRLGPAASEISLSCIGSAASFSAGPVAPQEIVSLFGSGIGPEQPVVAQPESNGLFPFQLGGTQVTFDGVTAPLLYAGSNQINLVTPHSLQGKQSTHVCVLVNQAATNCIDIPVQPAAPDIFLPFLKQWSPLYQNNVLTLFLTGLGAMTPLPPDGAVTPYPPVAAPEVGIRVLFTWQAFNFLYYGSVSAEGNILYSGPAPLTVQGLAQINVVEPPFPSCCAWSGAPLMPLGPPSFLIEVTLRDGKTVDTQSIPVE